MNEPKDIEKKPILLPCIVGFLFTLSLFLIGWAAPVFVQMFRDFKIDPLPLNIRIISHIHWLWTLPLGCLVASILIWGSRRWSRKTRLIVDVIAIVLAVIVFIAFVLTTFRPYVGMSPPYN